MIRNDKVDRLISLMTKYTLLIVISITQQLNFKADLKIKPFLQIQFHC